MSLLDLASLVLAPTATKEGKVYSAIPDTGEGDMTFTRGSAATRVNSEGLIEKERANLLFYSQDFSDSNWVLQNNATITHNITDPNGGTTASRLSFDALTNSGLYQQQLTNFGTGLIRTASIYLKGTVGGENVMIGDANNRTRVTLTTDWFRYKGFAIDSSTFFIIYTDHISGASADTIDIAFAQYENGLVAQSYIPTTTSAVYEGITDDVPRVDYSGGGCPALKLEPQRSNLLPQSEYFGAYSVNNGTATANQIISPEGILNAYQFTENTGTSAHYIDTTSISVTSGNSYVISLFAKYDGRFLTIQGSSSIISSNYATFNLQTGEVEQENIGDASIEDYGNGWYRCIFKITATGTGSGAITILLNDSATGGRSRSYTGDGESGIYIYGFQVEAGSYSTSYIPTYGVSSTRVADSGVSDVDSLLTSNATYTWMVEFIVPEIGNGGGEITFKDVGGSSQLRIYCNQNNMVGLRVDDGSQNYYISVSVGDTAKCLFQCSNGLVKGFYNGALVKTFAIDTSMDAQKIHLGPPVAAPEVKQVLLFNTALTDAECIELTKL